MINRWAGALLALFVGAVMIWSWQTLQAQQRLARDLAITQVTLLHLKEENSSLNGQLAQIQADMERVQSDHDQLSSRLNGAGQQIADAESARQRAESRLQALQTQEQLWMADKAQLAERIAILTEEKNALEQRLSAAVTDRAKTVAAVKPSRRIIPPTGSMTTRDASVDADVQGNAGYVLGGPPKSAQQVDVRPADASTP